MHKCTRSTHLFDRLASVLSSQELTRRAHRFMLSSPAGFVWYDISLLQRIARTDLDQGYHGAAIGKGRQLAKTELEKLKLSELSMREAVMEAARMSVSRPSLDLIADIILEYTLSTTTTKRKNSSLKCHGYAVRRTDCMHPYQATYWQRQNEKQRRH